MENTGRTTRAFSPLRSALGIVGAYLIFGCLWIFLSDALLTRLSLDPRQLNRLQTYKGWFFVTVTAVLLFFLVLRNLRRIHRARMISDEMSQAFETLIKASPIPIQSLDADGLTTLWNPAAERVFGWTREEVLGQVNPMVPPEKKGEFLALRERVLQGEALDGVELRRRRKDGAAIDIRLSTAPLYGENGTVEGIMAAMVDITEQKRTGESLFREARINSALADLAGALLAGTSLPDLASMVLDHAKALTGSRFGYVGQIDRETGYLVAETMTRDIWEECRVADKAFVFKEFNGLWGWSLKHRQPVLSNDPGRDPRTVGTPEGHLPIECLIAVPAMAGETLVGQIAVANAPSDYTDEDLTAVRRLADLYALAIQHWHNHDEVAGAGRFAHAVIDALSQHIAILDQEGTIISVNQAWRDFAAANDADPDVISEGCNYLDICEAAQEECREARAFLQGIRAVAAGDLKEFSLGYPCHSQDEERWFIGRARRIGEEKPVRIVVTHENISDIKQAEMAIRHRAYHDPLTELPNRLLFFDRLGQSIAQAQRDRHPFGVLFVDLDNFKEINDSLGHSTGDQLLKMAAERLQGCIRKSDTAARFGGDEFVVILATLAHSGDAAVIARKIIEAFAAPFPIGREEIRVGASIGIALFPKDGQDIDSLVGNADMAMYRAKEEGRNTFRFSSPGMSDPSPSH